MRIERIQITNLFGMFDHDIRLHTEERITIIHGPNGVGKTTVLKLVTDLFSGRFDAIASVPFDLFAVTFEDNRTLLVRRQIHHQKPLLSLCLTKGRTKGKVTVIRVPADLEQLEHCLPLGMIDEVIPQLERTGPRQWLDRSNDSVLSFGEVLSRYGDLLPISSRFRQRTPADISPLLESTPIHFIQTQRLFVTPPALTARVGRRPRFAESAVEKYAREMAEKIQGTLRESGIVAASLDRTFPQRLLQSTLPSKATEKTIRGLYQQQTQYRKRLMAAGLIESEAEVALPRRQLTENDRKVLWCYLTDVQKKLVVFDSLLAKVELFSDIVNTRFLFKSFRVDKTDGFTFVSETHNPVPLRALSSGEQHEIVLAYELLFKVTQNSLILIDEPELSLHVTWQHLFLDDIARISKLANLDFLVATHSPSIIHKRRSLMVQLKKR